ncbi:ABC transporter permease [Cellulomonas sp. URHB0016]
MSTQGSLELGSGAAIRMIAGREIRFRLTSKAFVWTTVALVAAVVLGGVAAGVLGDRETPTQHVGLTSATADAADQIVATGAAVGVTIETQEVASEVAGHALLKSGELDALVTSTSPALTVEVHQSLGDALAPVLGSLAQQLALGSAVNDLGGDPASVAADIAAAEPVVTSLEPPDTVDGAQVVAGYIAGILLFLSLMTAGQLVAQGVVEEKSSRVVELLLATVRPWQLMAGKVLGIGVIGLIQIVAVVASGVATALAFGLVDSSSIDLGATAAWAVAWFAIGFAMYALVLAALASLVSRQEDVSSVISPVIGLMVLPYILGISIAPWDPDNPLIVWLSFVPFFSPLLMPIRIALDAVALWEVLLAAGLCLALIPVLVWFAGRVYSNAVLHSGGRVRLKDALQGTQESQGSVAAR